jgi:hypothetical protein
MRLPDEGRDVAETDVGAGKADVPEEMIVKLQKVLLDPTRLNRLAAPQERGNQATGKEKDCFGGPSLVVTAFDDVDFGERHGTDSFFSALQLRGSVVGATR